MSDATTAVPADTAELSAEQLAGIDAYWRAANYLSVGQIYLLDNALLAEPLSGGAHEAAAPRPLGHHPRAQLHLRPSERIINVYDLDMIYIAGPGHGGPALMANTWLEGTYSEL